MFQQQFLQTLSQYTSNNTLSGNYWLEIERNYSSKKRHYHNLLHLDNLLKELIEYQPLIKDWDMMIFAIAWHDIIYNVLKQDNELKSAVFAEKKLLALDVAPEKIEKCKALVNATKSHQAASDADVNLFTDADLSILGKPWDVYELYTKQIRAEYGIYPDIIYKPGRRKALQHFLNMPRIFKTEQFAKYEENSRVNLQRELQEL